MKIILATMEQERVRKARLKPDQPRARDLERQRRLIYTLGQRVKGNLRRVLGRA